MLRIAAENFLKHSITSIIYKYSDGDVDNWVGGKGDKGGDGGGTDFKKRLLGFKIALQ